MVCRSGETPFGITRIRYQRWVRRVKGRSPASPSEKEGCRLAGQTGKACSSVYRSSQESEGVPCKGASTWGALADFVLTTNFIWVSCLSGQCGKLFKCFCSKYPKLGHWDPGFPSWMLGKVTPKESSLARWIRDEFPKLVLHREFSLVD